MAELGVISFCELFQLCNKYYSKKKLDHALRVANYAIFKARDLGLDESMAFAIGLSHDLLEDTDCSQKELIRAIGDNCVYAVCLLTKDKDEEYTNYIQRILKSHNKYAFIVKQADLKDHMALTDTLTDKLRDKYIPILHYFL